MYNVHNRKLQLKCQWTSIFLIKTKQYRVHVDDCPLGYIPYFFILNRLIQHISYNVNYLFPRLVKRFQSRSTQKKLRPSMTGRCIYALDVEWYIYFFQIKEQVKANSNRSPSHTATCSIWTKHPGMMHPKELILVIPGMVQMLNIVYTFSKWVNRQ